MENNKTIKIMIVIIFILIITLFYRVLSPQIDITLWSGTDIAICSSLGIFILSLIITIIRTYK